MTIGEEEYFIGKELIIGDNVLNVNVGGSAKVGINTDEPLNELHVRGVSPKIRVDATGTGQDPGIQLINSTDSKYGIILYAPDDQQFEFAPQGAIKMVINSVGNVGIGVSAFGTSATNVLGIKADGTVPSSSPAGMIQIFADDSSAGATNATLALRTEEAVATENLVGDSTLNIWINGTEYHLLLRAV